LEYAIHPVILSNPYCGSNFTRDAGCDPACDSDSTRHVACCLNSGSGSARNAGLNPDCDSDYIRHSALQIQPMTGLKYSVCANIDTGRTDRILHAIRLKMGIFETFHCFLNNHLNSTEGKS
jgi:hypothetical protein